MISSQLLLTAFVLYWLMGQYREERSLLEEQLRTEYVQVQEELVDSMLMQHLVMPVLDDSVKIIVQGQQLSGEGIWMHNDSSVVRMRHRVGDLPEELIAEEIKISAFHRDTSLFPDSAARKIDFTSIITEEETMVRSVKLFINNNPATFQSDTGMKIFAAMYFDSCSLARNMENVLEERGWTFSLDWPANDPDNNELKDKRVIRITGGPYDRRAPMQVGNYQAYLFRGILPQILFALVLLLLSASALLFSYRSMNRQLALNRLRDDFIANISHELKTPVSTVKIALEALKTFDMQKDPKVAGEYLDMAGKELKRLEGLVAKVLDHQLLDNTSLQLDLESCDLCELTRKVVHALEIPIRERGAKISIEEEGSCSAMADRVYVEGMIMNLIDNSLKYSGEHPQITIRIASTSTSIELSVSDQGPGIPEEFKDQIFEKFFRIPQGDTHNVKGYGLGLNFAAQVMAQHGGRISHKNLPEGGCRFTLLFPRSQA